MSTNITDIILTRFSLYPIFYKIKSLKVGKIYDEQGKKHNNWQMINIQNIKWTPNNKTTNNPVGKWAKHMNRLFREKETRIFNGHLRIFLSSLLIKEIQNQK